MFKNSIKYGSATILCYIHTVQNKKYFGSEVMPY